MTRRLAVLIGTVALVGGCASLTTQRRSGNDWKDGAVEGLVVSVTKPHEVTAIFPADVASSQIVEYRATVPLPAVNEYYVIGYRGDLFFARELQVDLQPDSSLKRVKIASTATAAQDLEGIATALQGVSTQIKSIQADTPAPVDPAVKKNADLRQEIVQQMLEANKNAAAAGQPIPYNDIKLP